MTALLIPGMPVSERWHVPRLEHPLAAPRYGVMLHYDDSARDDWAVQWFSSPNCTYGYTWLVLDDGRVIELADPGFRTLHAGPCLRPNANSVHYGIAVATNGTTLATPAQVQSIVDCTAALFAFHHWSADSVTDRIVGHDAQAIWTAAYTKNPALWGKLGRKVDPTGTRADRVPIIDIDAVRRAVAARL
jgi:N-acetyl-anhydromuramyl-L-alanine amidase AmpD